MSGWTKEHAARLRKMAAIFGRDGLDIDESDVSAALAEIERQAREIARLRDTVHRVPDSARVTLTAAALTGIIAKSDFARDGFVHAGDTAKQISREDGEEILRATAAGAVAYADATIAALSSREAEPERGEAAAAWKGLLTPPMTGQDIAAPPQPDALKPCPFCGGKATEYDDGKHNVVCASCDIRVRRNYMGVARHDWNSRPRATEPKP